MSENREITPENDDDVYQSKTMARVALAMQDRLDKAHPEWSDEADGFILVDDDDE